MKNIVWTSILGKEDSIKDLFSSYCKKNGVMYTGSLTVIPTIKIEFFKKIDLKKFSQDSSFNFSSSVQVISSKNTVLGILGNKDTSHLRNIPTIVVGSITKSLCEKEDFNLIDVPAFSYSNEVVEYLNSNELIRDVLLPGGVERSSNISARLKTSIDAHQINLYKTHPVESSDIDQITLSSIKNFENSSFITAFSSPSSVRSYSKLVG
ncbi:uroporphyrinogen-III synthase, partial [bacterium]|nr:uroporphyrinogen-III synthase [bacterium]